MVQARTRIMKQLQAVALNAPELTRTLYAKATNVLAIYA
jgi:hypothetical protein